MWVNSNKRKARRRKEALKQLSDRKGCQAKELAALILALMVALIVAIGFSGSSSVVNSIENTSSQLSYFTPLPGHRSVMVSTVKREFMFMFLTIHCRLIIISIVPNWLLKLFNHFGCDVNRILSFTILRRPKCGNAGLH